MKITTYKADHGTDGGVGFLINTDGLVIFHSGDHFNDGEKLKESFTVEIDYLAQQTHELDFPFICGPYELMRQRVYYAINRLQPKVMFPVHAGGEEYLYHQFAERAEKKNFKSTIVGFNNRGDRFFYTRDIIKENSIKILNGFINTLRACQRLGRDDPQGL